MNIEKLAKQWLIEHEHYEYEPSFADDLDSLVALLVDVLDTERQGNYIGDDPEYDPGYGDNRKCECTHSYYRHFDTYDGMAPVGCKYCFHDDSNYGAGHCAGFKEQIIIQQKFDWSDK
jgi:hypothetical protein